MSGATENAVDETDFFQWGVKIKFEEFPVASNFFNHLTEPSYDAPSQHGFWPMSEDQYNKLLPSRGFRENNGHNYRGYLVDFFKSIPPAGAAEASYHMFMTRTAELNALDVNSTSVFDMGRAQRRVDVAREVLGWADGAGWVKRNNKPEAAIFTDYDYFERWRIKSGLDYWILPRDAVSGLINVIMAKHDDNDVDCVKNIDIPEPNRWPLEISLNAYDDDKPGEIIYSKCVPDGCYVVCTRAAGLICNEAWLDDDEMLRRRRAARQLESDERKRKRDSGDNYFDLVMPNPNPADEPGFWDLSIGAQLRKFPSNWSAGDKYRAILVCSGSESKYQRIQRTVAEMVEEGARA